MTNMTNTDKLIKNLDYDNLSRGELISLVGEDEVWIAENKEPLGPTGWVKKGTMYRSQSTTSAGQTICLYWCFLKEEIDALGENGDASGLDWSNTTYTYCS